MKIHVKLVCKAAPACKETTPNLHQTCLGNPTAASPLAPGSGPRSPPPRPPGASYPRRSDSAPSSPSPSPPGAVAHGGRSHWLWRKQGLEVAVLIGQGASAELGSLASRWGKPSRRLEQPGALEGDRASRTRGSQPVDRGRGLEVRVTRPGARGRPFQGKPCTREARVRHLLLESGPSIQPGRGLLLRRKRVSHSPGPRKQDSFM